jgi:hypothetical protein
MGAAKAVAARKVGRNFIEIVDFGIEYESSLGFSSSYQQQQSSQSSVLHFNCAGTGSLSTSPFSSANPIRLNRVMLYPDP